MWFYEPQMAQWGSRMSVCERSGVQSPSGAPPEPHLRGSAWIPGQDPVPCPLWHWASVRPGQRPRSGRVPVAEARAPQRGTSGHPLACSWSRGAAPRALSVQQGSSPCRGSTRSFRDRSASLQSGHESRRRQGLLFLLKNADPESPEGRVGA